MKFKKLLPLTLVLTFFAIGCSNGTTTNNEQQETQNQETKDASEGSIELIFNNTSTSQPHRDFGETFAKLTDEKTEGMVKIETFFGDSIAEYGIQPVISGTVDFNQVIPSNADDLSKKLTLLDAPYILNDFEHALEVISVDSPIIKEINNEIINENVRFITAYPMGFRHITSNKK